jgi:DNA adenine methylase
MEYTLLEIHWRLARVTIEHLDVLDCIRRYDRKKTFFYLDPPYYDTAGYGTPFGHDDYIRLSDCLNSIDGRFLLSLNDHPEVRKIFKAFRIRIVQPGYSVSNGRSSKSRSEPANEVFISNY